MTDPSSKKPVPQGRRGAFAIRAPSVQDEMKPKRKSRRGDGSRTGEDESKTLLGQGRASVDERTTQEDENPSSSSPSGTQTAIKKNKLLRILKIVMPHICLTLFILCYAMMGAAIFQRIEYDHDLVVLEEKATAIVNLYQRIANEVVSICHDSRSPMADNWDTNLYYHLSRLSSAHERHLFSIESPAKADPKDMVSSRWSYIDSILYSVSILTTTGYVNATPTTKLGQIVTVIYGLFGIPLMVLTAVDYGRFLSDIVLLLYSKLAKCSNRIMRISGCLAEAARKKVSSNVRVETKLLEDGRVEEIEAQRKPKLPLWANFSILLLFNTLGAFVYMLHGETKPDFLESFFVCFNLVANLTMGEVPVVRDLLMVIYIIFFVTFGLAVLSMCAELAATELKWLFLKIHYFGRKIRQKTKTVDEEEFDHEIASLLAAFYHDQPVPVYVEEVELKELLKIIDEIRHRYPQKHKITRQDILDYIQSQITSPTKDQFGFSFWSRRRDTIAFMPEGIDILKFADADDVDADEQSVYHRRPSDSVSNFSSSSGESAEHTPGSHQSYMIDV